jgi:hypothetical protein
VRGRAQVGGDVRRGIQGGFSFLILLAVSGRYAPADATVGRYTGKLDIAFSDRRAYQSWLLLVRPQQSTLRRHRRAN